jgi:hypothetical protein
MWRCSVKRLALIGMGEYPTRREWKILDTCGTWTNLNTSRQTEKGRSNALDPRAGTRCVTE